MSMIIRSPESLEYMVKHYASKYYSGESVVSDEYFDSLIDELRDLNPDSEILKTPGWGFTPEGEKHRHLYGLVVGSLLKIKRIEDIPDRFSPCNCRISAKLDGLSVVSYYDNGVRYLSLTRGNGSEGKDVTDKIDLISPETKRLWSEFTGAVRGEVLISSRTWDQIKDRYSDNPSANPRNLASGIMNRNYVDEETSFLDYVVYKVVADPKKEFSDDKGNPDFVSMTGFLMFEGFTAVPSAWRSDGRVFSRSHEELEDYYKNFCKEYPCDGLVFTLTEGLKYSKEGEILYDEFAYKFRAESEEVVVTKVDWNATRTGRIVPRIWFDPVKLSGAVVQKCTGHNAAFIRDNKINKGTVIEVCRSNEVIPYVMRVVSNHNSEGMLPDTCPSCGGDLVWSGDDLVCENENESQLVYRFISVVGSQDGAGWKTYSKVIESFGLNTLEDLVKFIKDLKSKSPESPEDFSSIVCPAIRGSATQKIVMNILFNLCREVDPSTFLVSCNIKGISWNTAELLSTTYPEYFDHIKESRVDYDRMYEIKGFGYSTVSSLRHFESRVRDLSSVLSLSSERVGEDSEEVSHQFNIAITGSLSMKRSEFIKIAESKGISQSSNFKEIRYLVTNNPESTSSKMKKALDYGVEIISEEKFFEKFLK